MSASGEGFPVLYGLETEYGITRESPGPDYDVVAESIGVVRAAKEDGVRLRWDYAEEDPHVDARGFRVASLRQDTDEARYEAQDEARPWSFAEIKSDLVLANGARFYNDHAHPEYCTPECSRLAELLRQDQLGDSLVMRAAEALSASGANAEEGRVRIYKNNTDFFGHSYGCHENYLLPRRLSWERLSRGMRAFLATRQIFAGAGKFAWEREDAYEGPGFQISQRSDFFSVLESVDTMQRRPLVNTRDEPHADPARWRRFHVICGDANLSPYATYLKVGATAAVLAALEQIDPDSIPELEDPVGAMREISRDAGWQWPCDLADGRYSSAIEVQRRYLELVRASGVECGDGFRLGDWEGALEDLERDPYALADRLDWVAKHRLIAAFREEHNIGEEDPWLMSLDLSYHLLDEQEGLFFALKDQGQWQLPLGLENDPEPLLEAPRETRAAVRGRCIARFGDVVESAQWDHVTLSSEGLRLRLELGGLFGAESVKEALAVVEAAADLRDLLALPFAKIVEGG